MWNGQKYRPTPTVAFNDSPNATSLLQWNAEPVAAGGRAAGAGQKSRVHRGTDVQGREACGWLPSERPVNHNAVERRTPAVAFNDSPNASELLHWDVQAPGGPQGGVRVHSKRGTDVRGRAACGWLPKGQPKDNLVHLQWKQQQQQQSLAAQRESIAATQRPQRPPPSASAFNDSPNASALLKWDTRAAASVSEAEHLTHRGTDIRGRKATGWLPSKADMQERAVAGRATPAVPATAFNDSPNAAGLLRWDTRGPKQTTDPRLLTHRGTDVRSRKACGWIEDAQRPAIYIEPAAPPPPPQQQQRQSQDAWAPSETFGTPSANSVRAALPPQQQAWPQPSQPGRPPAREQQAWGAASAPQAEQEQRQWQQQAAPTPAQQQEHQAWSDPPLEPAAQQQQQQQQQPYIVEAPRATNGVMEHGVPSAPSRYFATTGFNSKGARERVNSAMPAEEDLRAHRALTSGYEPIAAEYGTERGAAFGRTENKAAAAAFQSPAVASILNWQENTLNPPPSEYFVAPHQLPKGRKVREDAQLKESFASFVTDPIYKHNPMAGARLQTKASEDGYRY